MSWLVNRFRSLLSRGNVDREYIALAVNTGSRVSYPAERISTLPPMKKLEALFKVDPITFGIVHELIDSLVGVGFYFEGENELEIRRLTEWAEDIGFQFLLEDIVLDICVYGNAWVEIVWDTAHQNIEKFVVLDPKTMDYKRTHTGEIELDETGEPVAIVQTNSTGKQIYWYKDRIEDRSGEILYKAKLNEDLRKRIAHFKLWGFGDSKLGMTPLETCHYPATVRLNLIKSTGEAAFHSEGLIAYVSGRPSEEAKENIKKALVGSSSNDLLILDERVKLDRIPSPEIRGRERLVYAFMDEQCVAFGVPLRLIAEGLKEFAGEFEWRQIKFEMRLQRLQKRLAHQVREQILKQLWEAWGYTSRVPRIVFNIRTPGVKLSRSRQIATLARRGLIRRDPLLEKALRQEYDLPTEFLEREIEEWRSNPEHLPEISPEIDKQLELETPSKKKRSRKKKA